MGCTALMPCTLAKLPCGVIYTEAFAAYLDGVYLKHAEAHPRRVMTLDYIRCASGPMKGRAWWQVLWVPQETVPEYRCYRMGRITVHIPKNVQHGLRERCLDFEDGRVVVKP